MTDSDRHFCICRTLHNRKPCWMVSTKRQGKLHRKYFCDHLHGGSDAALEKARQWRDEVFASYPAHDKLYQSTFVRKNNTSGHPGVFLYKTRQVTRSGKILHYHYWQALSPRGMTPFRTRSFSVRKYGDAEAYDLALAARQEFEMEFARMEG